MRGVRSSWLTFAKNCVFICSSSSVFSYIVSRARHMSCTGDCDAYAAALGEEGVVLVDERGEVFHTVPYETLRGRLRGEGTLAALFARSQGDEE